MQTRISLSTPLVWTATACFVMLLTACTFAAVLEPNTVPTEPNKTEPNKPAEAAVDSVAVTVNGVDIKESQVDAQLAPQLKKKTAQLTPAFIEQYKKQLRPQVLDNMIIEQLLDEKVEAAKITVTDEESTEKIKEMASQQSPPLSMEDFRTLLETYGQNFDEVKQQIKKGLGYQRLMTPQAPGALDVNEDEARVFYAKYAEEYEVPEQVRASHILIMPDPNKAKADAKAKAENLLKQIKDGADFAELAKANSDCPSSEKGGDLGFFSRGKMVPAFEEAAFALKVGQVSDVVETEFGYHIIKIIERKGGSVKRFEEVKNYIIDFLKPQKQAKFYKEYKEKLKARANIVYPPGKEPKKPAREYSIPIVECEACGRKAEDYDEAGRRCPFCGVYWSYIIPKFTP